MLVYLDQNHASRIAKHLLGQPHHEAFGRVHAALRSRRPCVPPSPFHVLETRGGYLLPTLREFFADLSGGVWVRPYAEVVRRQARRGGLDRRDLLSDTGDWIDAATLTPLADLLETPLEGSFFGRCERVRHAAAERFEVPPDEADRLPFFRLLGRLVAFRSLDRDRRPRPSDLIDLVMAATVAPYVDVLATDRYVRELLLRVGHRGPVFSGRRPDVDRFAAALAADVARGVPDGAG